MGGTPFYVDHAKGPYLFDVDGNSYLDFVSSWGAIILGHGDEGLIREAQAAVADGTSFGACHPYEPVLAPGLIIDAFPSMKMVRLTNSGTEATMSAVRLARGRSDGEGGDYQIQGLLSRPRGQFACQGRVRSGHLWSAGQRGDTR